MKKRERYIKICHYCTWYISTTKKCFKKKDTSKSVFCSVYKHGYCYMKDNLKYVEER